MRCDVATVPCRRLIIITSDPTTAAAAPLPPRCCAVIYLDQPAGAGFSYSKTAGYDHNQTQVSADVYRFLQAFLAAHPELQGRPFFVTGESYGACTSL